VKRLAVLAVLALRLAVPVYAASDPPQQTVTPIAPAEQRVEALTPSGEQRVEAVDANGVQQVSEGTKSPGARVANGVAKVTIGVMAATISIAAMAASLMFL
jgi:hypothetical protein